MSVYRPGNSDSPLPTSSPIQDTGSDAANDQDFRRRPLAIAVDELGAQLTGAGFDPDAGSGADRPELSDEELVRLVFDRAQAPPDLPERGMAFAGFAAGLRSLAAVLRACSGLSTAVDGLRTSQVLGFSAGLPMLRPLAGRREQFMEYDFLLRVAASKAEDAPRLTLPQPLDEPY